MHKNILIIMVKTLVQTDKWIKSYHQKHFNCAEIFAFWNAILQSKIALNEKVTEYKPKTLLSANLKKVHYFSVLLIVKELWPINYSKRCLFQHFSNSFFGDNFLSIYLFELGFSPLLLEYFYIFWILFLKI